MRVAIAGLQHETNTFAPMPASYRDFVAADAWPELTTGDAIVQNFPGKNLPISGFMQAALNDNWDLEPLLWASAEPSSYVTDEAFERIATDIGTRLENAGRLDALYLDLHGAMVTQSFEDGEGELLQRLRKIVGTELPLVASLDLHANVTQAMIRFSDALTIYRTYPHLDMAETGARAQKLLARIFSQGKPAKSLRKAAFLTPLHVQCTEAQPNRSLYASLEPLAHGDIWSADLAAGFPPADIRECGPAVVTYATREKAAEDCAEQLMDRFEQAESAFQTHLHTPEEALAIVHRTTSKQPVLLADVQDNPGAGGTSDTTGLLKALVAQGARGALLGLFCAPEVAASAHTHGVGAVFFASLGGKMGGAGDGPFRSRFQVEALSDGEFPFTGKMYAGSVAELGPTALLRIHRPDCQIQVLVGSHRCQCLDQAIFRHIGADPAAVAILGVKSTVHFRADFEPIAHSVLPVICAGAHPCRLHDLAYHKLREGVRLGPDGPRFRPPSTS